MPLYRADFIDPEGKTRSAVTAADVRALPEDERPGIVPSGDLLTHHMKTMRALASAVAQRAEADVAIRSITGAGRIRTVLIATFDGRFRRPDNTTSTVTADHNTDGPCFCAACRADRKAPRAKGGNR
jgi:hypothetical protein